MIVWGCVLLALIMRVAFFPGSAGRDLDEPGYVQSGMMLAEGLTPTYKAAPAAPQIWLTWSYVMASSAIKMVHPAVPERTLPGALKPYGAVNAALFDLYRDASSLRNIHLALVILAGLLGTWAAATLGAERAGPWAALLLGGTFACGELFVAFSLMTRPYICGWSLALVAVVLAERAVRRARFGSLVGAFVVLGLAVASRIEMLTVVPLLLWIGRDLLWPRWMRRGVLLLVVLVATMLLVAPWWMTSLITNLKSIVAVRGMGGSAGSGAGSAVREIALDGGLAIVSLAALAGIVVAFRSLRIGAAVTLAIITGIPILMALHGSGYGLHHDGGALVCLLFLASLGLAHLPAPGRIFAMVIAIVSVAGAFAYTVMDRTWRVPIYSTAPVAAWLEQHVKPNARLIWMGQTVVAPLPTQASANEIWSECANAAWSDKYGFIAKSLSLPHLSDPPRGLSIDNMTKEYAEYRGWFILGSRTTLPTPRFDLFPAIGLGLRQNISPIDDYQSHDAVYVLSSETPPPASLGTPVVSWDSSFGRPTYVFAKPGVLITP